MSYVTVDGLCSIIKQNGEVGLVMLDLKGKLSVVMPAYNEEKLIYQNILETVETLSRFVSDFEVIVVNDGSKDRTKAEVQRAMKVCPQVRLSGSDKNHGKGAAVLLGVTEAKGDFIAFVDADLELHPRQLEKYLSHMLDTGCDIVIGSKLDPESELEYPFVRRVISYCYYIMLNTMFHLHVRDTQTGLKVFRASAIKPVAHLIRTSGFAYDIELLTACSRRGATIESLPVQVVYVRDSRRIHFSDGWRAFKDTWAIFNRVYVKHYYDEH